MATTRFVALLRAVNVGGHGRIRMTQLREVFTGAGAQAVQTCIQSGNVLFVARAADAGALIRRVGRALVPVLGHEPAIMLRAAHRIRRLAATSPFAPDAPAGEKHYVAFLSARPARTPALPVCDSTQALELVAVRGSEALVLSRPRRSGFYGIPNSFVERELDVVATTRNWSTVARIAALIEHQGARAQR